MRVLQVTIGASPVQLTTQNIYASVMLVTSSGTDYLGDDTVSSTKGIPLFGTPTIIPFNTRRGSLLSQYWVTGTSGDKVTVLYETSE